MSSLSTYTPEQKAEYNRLYQLNMPPEVREHKNARARQVKSSQRHFLAGYKLWFGCVDCGYRVDALALDLDHVRGDKQFSLACAAGWDWLGLLVELEKCEVRCANCHRIRTWRKEQL